jgi:hypothetical protein
MNYLELVLKHVISRFRSGDGHDRSYAEAVCLWAVRVMLEEPGDAEGQVHCRVSSINFLSDIRRGISCNNGFREESLRRLFKISAELEECYEAHV